MKPKILILHASAGHGHAKCADAIQKAFALTHPDYNVAVFDALDFTPGFCKFLYRGSYLFLIRHLPFLWALLYNVHDVASLSTAIWPLRRLHNHLMTQKLVQYIEREQPAAIVCTHFMPTEVVGTLKAQLRYKGILLTVITDFMPHYFWLNPHVDYFIAGLPETAQELQKRGVESGKIIQSGIPVDPTFHSSSIHAQAKQKMGLDPDSFVVLLTGGGAGVGATEKLCRALSALDAKLEIVVIAGTNQNLKKQLQQDFITNENVHVQGFVSNMHEWIDACDVMVGKGGGLTVTETLAVGRPMILVNPVPGQEILNARLVEHHGAGFMVKTPDEAIEYVQDLLQDALMLERCQRNVKAMGRPNAAIDLAKFIARKTDSKALFSSDMAPANKVNFPNAEALLESA